MSFKNISFQILSLLTACMFCFSSASGDDIQDYVEQIPGIGLIADEVNFEGITLSHLAFAKDKGDNDSTKIADKYVITDPGQKHRVIVDYKIDSDVLDNLILHHFIYGLHNDGPQGCLVHSIGVSDKEGVAEFTVNAPDEPGVYQLRFCHAKKNGSFAKVKKEWWKSNSATAKTIMGIVVVRDNS